MLYAEISKSLNDGLKHNHYDEWVIMEYGIVISKPMIWKTIFKEAPFLNPKIDRSERVLDHFRKHYDNLVDMNGIADVVKAKALGFVKGE